MGWIRRPGAGVDGAGPLDHRTTILVIDDQLEVRRHLRTVLELAGCQVYEAMNGPLGLGLSGAIEPGVVLIDVMLSGMSGVDVCRSIDHERHAVIVLTEENDPLLEAECLAAGADCFVAKPIDPDVLKRTLFELISGRPRR